LDERFVSQGVYSGIFDTWESLFMDHRSEVPPRPACMQALGLLPPYSVEDVHRAYREQAKRAHPDAGGSTELFTALHDTYERALDLATFQDSRRDWMGQRVERHLERTRLIEEIESRGGRCRLRLPDTYLADYGPDFADMLCELITVHLTGDGGDDAALELLANSTAAQEIQLLDLSGSRITDHGLLHLANLRLRGLDLRNTSASMSGLTKLPRLSALEWIHLGQTKLGMWNRWQLRRKSPGLELVTAMTAKHPDFESDNYRQWKLMQRLAQDPR
jgi:hypothetical protein